MIVKPSSFCKSLPCLLVGSFLLLLAGVSVTLAKGKSTLEIPRGLAGIFAYGSLISLPSMEDSLGHKYSGPIHDVHLRGYERVWICVRPWNDPQAAGVRKPAAHILRGTERVPILGAAELDLQSRKKGRVNGVLYLVTDEELRKFDQREWGYRRADVTDRIEEYRFRGGRVYVYEGLPRPQPSSATDKGTYVLIKEFLGLVTGACDARGNEFRADFDRTTKACPYPVVSYKDIIWETSK